MAAYKDKPREKWVQRRGFDYYGKSIRRYLEMGGRILTGTDGALEYILPGWSLHLELDDLVRCGLSPYEALCASTTWPAEFLEIQKEEGTIEEGKKARLLILKGNPLEDIQYVHNPVYVIKDQWILNQNDCKNIRRKSREKTEVELEFI